MRRAEQRITEPGEIEAILRESRVCRMAMADGGKPYVVPVCFGYRDRTLYIHSSREGRKVEILRRNPEVCVEFDLPGPVVEAPGACASGICYRSVLAFGTAVFVDDAAERTRALDAITEHYAGRRGEYSESALRNTLVIRVDVREMTGKRSRD